MEIIQENNKNFKVLITALKNGAVLVLPTDTVYGLICDATNKKAVEKIYSLKKRDKSKSLPVFVKDIKMAEKYSVINKSQKEYLKINWPGAVTVVLKRKTGLAKLVYKNNTIALRQPDYKLITEIIKVLKKPLAQSSANISDNPASTKIKAVLKYFKKEDVLLVDAGNLPKSKPSTIIDLTGGNIKVIRK